MDQLIGLQSGESKSSLKIFGLQTEFESSLKKIQFSLVRRFWIGLDCTMDFGSLPLSSNKD